MTTIKAITLIQPWATLIAIGEKRIETRSWNTNYRGPIAIHAGKTPPVLDDLEEAVLKDHGVTDLPLGAVIATATLVDCWMFSPDFGDALRLGFVDFAARYEHAFGDFDYGRFGWQLDNVTPLPESIPARGFQGLWNWDGAE